MSRHLMAKMTGGRRRTAGWADWKPAPELDDPDRDPREVMSLSTSWSHNAGIVDHHVAPLENGHKLTVRRWANPGSSWSNGPWDFMIDGVSSIPELSNYHPSDDSYATLGHAYQGLPTKEHAMQAAEDAYRRLTPAGTNTGGHDSGVDYSDLNKFMGEL